MPEEEVIYYCKCIIPDLVLTEIIETYGTDNISVYWKGTKRDLEAIERLYKDRALINQAIKKIEQK